MQTYHRLFIVLLVLSVLASVSTYLINYMLGFSPCALCIYETLPYGGIMKIAITGLIIKKLKTLSVFFLCCTTVFGITLSSYHLAIKYKVMNPVVTCEIKKWLKGDIFVERGKSQEYYDEYLQNCVVPEVKILDFSFPSLHIMVNLFFLILIVITIVKVRKEEKV